MRVLVDTVRFSGWFDLIGHGNENILKDLQGRRIKQDVLFSVVKGHSVRSVILPFFLFPFLLLV